MKIYAAQILNVIHERNTLFHQESNGGVSAVITLTA